MRTRSFFSVVVATFAVACSKPVDEPKATFVPSPAASPNVAPTKLEIVDLVEGKGPPAKSGDTVHVQYTGTLLDGTKFDSSYDHGEAFKFTLGNGQVIKGWDQGVVGMKAGGRRRLRIPPDLAYGVEHTPPDIPPNASLIFEVELVSID